MLPFCQSFLQDTFLFFFPKGATKYQDKVLTQGRWSSKNTGFTQYPFSWILEEWSWSCTSFWLNTDKRLLCWSLRSLHRDLGQAFHKTWRCRKCRERSPASPVPHLLGGAVHMPGGRTAWRVGCVWWLWQSLGFHPPLCREPLCILCALNCPWSLGCSWQTMWNRSSLRLASSARVLWELQARPLAASSRAAHRAAGAAWSSNQAAVFNSFSWDHAEKKASHVYHWVRWIKHSHIFAEKNYIHL